MFICLFNVNRYFLTYLVCELADYTIDGEKPEKMLKLLRIVQLFNLKSGENSFFINPLWPPCMKQQQLCTDAITQLPRLSRLLRSTYIFHPGYSSSFSWQLLNTISEFIL